MTYVYMLNIYVLNNIYVTKYLGRRKRPIAVSYYDSRDVNWRRLNWTGLDLTRRDRDFFIIIYSKKATPHIVIPLRRRHTSCYTCRRIFALL